MTQIITIARDNDFFLASDSRLEYHKDTLIRGIKYKAILATADCIQKTFYIKKARIGVQFLGIGYFPYNNENYPLSYFISKINQLNFKYKNFSKKCKIIYNFLEKLSNFKDTKQFVKGNMVGFQNNKKYICTFNTYNKQFKIQEIYSSNFVNSKNTKVEKYEEDALMIKEIEKNILTQSKKEPWHIGGEIDVLKITKYSGKFLEKNPFIFNGDQKELVELLNSDTGRLKIKGEIFLKPILIKYS